MGEKNIRKLFMINNNAVLPEHLSWIPASFIGSFIFSKRLILASVGRTSLSNTWCKLAELTLFRMPVHYRSVLKFTCKTQRNY